MNVHQLFEMIEDSTRVSMKGDEADIRESGTAQTIALLGYPHTSQYETINLIFFNVVVDKQKAEKYKDELKTILNEYPSPGRLAGGPSYIELAGAIGIEQGTALRLMALGSVARLWDVITPETLLRNGGSNWGKQNMARQGLIMIAPNPGRWPQNPNIRKVK
ncbi:MAG: hypothetical protein ACYCO0_01365 [Candidatus Micrarchaeaceae archaeon]